MPKAVWNGTILAESDKTVVVEGNHYFPPDSLNRQYFNASKARTNCPWKGRASYYDIAVNGKVNRGTARYYPKPMAAARNIRGYVAFWKGVKVESNREKASGGLLGWLWM